MSKPRPTLDSLSSRFATKATDPAPVAPSAPEHAPAAAPASTDRPPAAKKDSRVQILTRVDAMTRKRLRMIALEQDRTVQDICEEAIRDFVARNHR